MGVSIIGNTSFQVWRMLGIDVDKEDQPCSEEVDDGRPAIEGLDTHRETSVEKQREQEEEMEERMKRD